MTCSRYYYLEVEDWNGMYAEIAVEFDFFPGEKMVRYDRNGDGYPGSPPEVEIIGASVLYLEGEGYRYDRPDMGDWAKCLDRLAFKYVEGLDLYDECVDCVCN